MCLDTEKTGVVNQDLSALSCIVGIICFYLFQKRMSHYMLLSRCESWRRVIVVITVLQFRVL